MPSEILKQTEEKMDQIIEHFRKELTTIRTGRASTSVLDKVEVEYYGMSTPLNQVAALSIPEARQIMIKPFDKSLIGEIQKALSKIDLGGSPNDDGEVIRINLPALTEDRRKDLVKDVKKKVEGQKVAVRNIRRDAVDAIKKLKLPEDDTKGYNEDIQKLTDKKIIEVEQVAIAKEKDIMTI